MANVTTKNLINSTGISVKKELLNKYASVEDIFIHEKSKIKSRILIGNNIEELQTVDLEKIKIGELKSLAYRIFCNYHNIRIFTNDSKKILVSRSGINESIEKIYHNRVQRELLLEHLKIFSSLGDIIEKAHLVNQAYENKGRFKYHSWNYYLDGIIMNNQEYLLEFEVVTLDSGENHYRVQRLDIK